ncbi:cobaltochelatase subunit CobN [Methanothermobacter sp. EMTCatA1]|uniref:cobaltochelatase subunit CobN n=1 Tax=Methanothermobacter sp. EMTCatA1 TaxID=2017966 RepID=UPI000B60163B|nr:cobaltochelatase subunit CobN [Methanothermobacter sp. EMTCatA1]BAZ99366.1 Aerobic cobaltochelatase subunit CobN [Methanothermobacter sp. EMTCatA1]
MRISVIPVILLMTIMLAGGVSAADNSSNVTEDAIQQNSSHYSILIITGSTSSTKAIVEGYKLAGRDGYRFNLSMFTNDELLRNDPQIDMAALEAGRKADVILIQMISSPNTLTKVNPILNVTGARKIIAIGTGNTFKDNPRVGADNATVKYIWDQGGPENFRRMMLLLLRDAGMQLKNEENVTAIPAVKSFVYHPDAGEQFTAWDRYYSWYVQSGHYRAGKPWVGIITFDTYYRGSDMRMHTAILESLERKGYNVILGFAADTATKRNLIENFFLDGNRTPRISGLITCMGFNLYSGDPLNSTAILTELDLPAIAAVYASNLRAWNESISGLSSEVYWQIALPEIDGRIEPVMIGGGVEETDPQTGLRYTYYVPIPDRIERLTERLINWIKLRELPNAEKKIALIYYNIGGGKDGISASYLNVPESISNILRALRSAGYNVEEKSTAEVINILLGPGLNVGSWAPGELEKVVRAGAVTVPVSEYLNWFSLLPETLRNNITATWGPAPGNVMVYNGSIVIPGVMLGNVFLGPQPMRGFGEDAADLIHSTTLPPHHQYLAFYLWLQKNFNAVIHLGTHGTLEWLPGKSVGLSSLDWPDVMIGDLPHIYPYIVNNPGEGTQAKRRGYAVLINHNIPPMVVSELYGDLSELEHKINLYHTSEDPQRKLIIAEEIRNLTVKLDLQRELNIDLNASFEEALDRIEHRLDELSATLIPYGLHVFGEPLSGELLDAMVEAIVSFDPASRNNTEFRNAVREKLATDQEITNLLRALEGRFVEPGRGADPIRIPDLLPTGRNSYSFDPRLAPDRAAWEIGKKMADDLIADYLSRNGRYPESVGVVLWAIETMRTSGQTIAMVLRLIGAEPVWDKSGRFTGISVTPLEVLGRPRIDVLVTISGLFRDTFAYSIDRMDEAIRLVMKLDEPVEGNYLRKHYLADLANYTARGLQAAETLAGARIFGSAPGSYGTGLPEVVESTAKWDNQSQLLETYLNHMGFIYGKDIYAIDAKEVFMKQLSNVDATVQVRDSVYGVLDNDDVYQYLGGLTMAARTISGRNVASYIANTRFTPRMETLADFIAAELRTRTYNPKWIEGMLNQGFSGAHQISKEIGHLFGWSAVTPDLVQDWMWQKVAETYVFDPQVSSRFKSLQPYSYASTVAWLLEASRRGLWSTDSATLQRLADEYIAAVNEYGVVCCHHTCANMVFNSWVVKLSSLNQAALRKFAAAMAAATGKSIDVPGSGDSQPGSVNGDGIGETGEPSSGSAGNAGGASGSSSDEALESSEVSENSGTSEGSGKAYEVAASTNSTSSSTQTPIYAIIGVISLMCLLGVGYFFQGRY